MDDAASRNHVIEEQYPEGKVKSGFNYSFSTLDSPPNTIVLELRMTGGDTLRLFFETNHFREFAKEVGVVVNRLI